MLQLMNTSSNQLWLVVILSVCVCVCVCVLRSVCNILLRMAYNTVYIESMEHATCCTNEMGSLGIFSSSLT